MIKNCRQTPCAYGIYIVCMNDNPIGIFDSGSGGLTVLDSCRNLLPSENYVYVSDSRDGGWGGLRERQIYSRARDCVERLCDYGCKVVVAACNTATGVAIGELRHEYDIPFVGLEPALKPAREAYPEGRILLLCTPATARQPKFAELMKKYGDRDVAVCPQPTLARKIEKNLHSLENLDEEVRRIADEEEAVAVVLGCTHYVFLRSAFEREYGGREHVFDGNAGAARRLKDILKSKGILSPASKMGHVVFDTV